MSWGKKHDYLGMDLDFMNDREVRVSMIEYLKKVISDFLEQIIGMVASPAADHLFEIRREVDRVNLSEDRGMAFHHAVTQLLFATQLVRKDIQNAMAFLMMQVRDPDEDD